MKAAELIECVKGMTAAERGELWGLLNQSPPPKAANAQHESDKALSVFDEVFTGILARRAD